MTERGAIEDMTTIDELLAIEETSEECAHREKWTAEYEAKPCKYDSTGECWTHGFLPRRPCGHVCYGIKCRRCSKPLTGRQRTRRRWARTGRR